MACDLSATTVRFTKSQINITPYSLDVRQSRQEENTFDHIQATISKKAGDAVLDNHIENEPVEILMGESSSKLYRGWFTFDALSHGESQSVLEIKDPRKILMRGYIDKEWGQITLRKLVNYIFLQRDDPQNVITDVEFASPDVDLSKLQIEDPTDWYGIDVQRTPEGATEWSSGLVNFMEETNPAGSGDGNFDFREETPHSALLEACNIWETSFWIRPDGTLVIGGPELETTVYSGGRGPKNWHISNWNLPEIATPLKAVVVKGKMDQKGGKDGNAEEFWNVITDKKKFQTRAAGGFLNDDNLEETIILNDKRPTTDPKVLRSMALRAFYEHYTQNNRGSITINANVDNEIPPSQYAGLTVGDKIIPNNIGSDCDKINPGLFDIHSIQHDINGKEGWKITLDVSRSIVDADRLETAFWYYDPTETAEFAGEDSLSL
jgi:hypothetical protein